MALRLSYIKISLSLSLVSFTASVWAEALPQPYEASVIVMGTIGKVQLWGLSKAQSHRIAEEIFGIWRQVDQTMSLYKPSSDLVRLNNAAGKQPVRVCPELMEILALAKDHRTRTQGLFDVRIGSLMDLWGLGVSPRKNLPTQKEFFVARRLFRRTDVLLFPRDGKALVQNTGVKIDLGGIAKGYVLDKATEILQTRAVPHAILDLGGQLMIYRPPPEGWLIGVREPGNTQGTIGVLKITNTCSVSTSSQEDRFVTNGKRQTGHILDPRTGYPVRRRGSVTVLTTRVPHAIGADVLSTALFIATPSERLKLLRNFPGARVLCTTPGRLPGTWDYWQSPEMEKLFELQRRGKEALAAGMV